jgi:hypothetical protein
MCGMEPQSTSFKSTKCFDGTSRASDGYSHGPVTDCRSCDSAGPLDSSQNIPGSGSAPASNASNASNDSSSRPYLPKVQPVLAALLEEPKIWCADGYSQYKCSPPSKFWGTVTPSREHYNQKEAMPRELDSMVDNGQELNDNAPV